MGIGTANRIGVLTALMLVLGTFAYGQDLGSANKLFGGGTKKAGSKAKTTKKPPSKPKTIARKSTAAPKATKSTVPAKSNAATKPKAAERVKKKIEVTKSKTAEPKTSAAANDLFEDLIDQGNAARDDREYAAAEAAYNRAQSLKPRDSRATYGLGNLYSDQHRWEEAETAYRNALEIDPTNAIAHIALSYVLTQPIAAPNLGDRYAEAERFARRAIQLDATNALGFDQLGVAMELRGLIGAETENAYRRAMQLDKTFAPAFAHLGRLLRRRGMAKESAAAYKNAVSLSTDVATMIVVAEVMQSELRFAESEPLLRSAIGGDPKNPAALLMLGRALTAQSKYYEAEQILKRGLAVSPNAFMPNSLLGSLFVRQGKLELAENALLQAIRHVSPYERRQLAQQFEAVGDGYKKAGRSVNAERAYRQARALDVENRSVANKFPKSRPD